jgi:hypothetical protein
MSNNDSLSVQCKRFKHELATNKRTTLLEATMEKTGYLVQRITRNSQAIPFWYSAVFIALLLLLIGLLASRLLGEFDLRHTMLVFWDVIFMLPTVIAVRIYNNRLRLYLRDHIVDAIQSGENLADLQNWWYSTTDTKASGVFALVFSVLSGMFASGIAYLMTGHFLSIGLTVVVMVVQILFGMGFYIAGAMLGLSIRMSRYQFKLFAADPSSSEIIDHLSNIFMTGVYLSVSIVVMFTLLNAVTGALPNVGLLLLVPLWAINIVLFIVTQYALSRIITTAKHRTLSEVQTKIEGLLTDASLTTKETRETVDWLLDYHDRVKATRNSALDVRAALGFLNSLLLPLLAFALANLDKIVALFR